MAQHNLRAVLGCDEISGCHELRQQIAQLVLDGGSMVNVDDIVITNDSQNGALLALLTVCQPGGIIAVGLPVYYGTMQLLRGLGVKVTETPADPDAGISVEALELALDQWPIKGVLPVPSCNDPPEFVMPDTCKQAVLVLTQRHDIVIFEGDVYGELTAEYPRPHTIHPWDSDDRAILCNSLIGSVASSLRMGWVMPGRYYNRLLHMEYVVIGANVPATRLVAASFMHEGHYHRHVHRIRQIYQRNMEIYAY